MNETVHIGVIGGSGLYEMDGLTDVEERRIDTPFGPPSDALVFGTLEGKRVAFLSRHSRGHKILPHEVNYRANVYAMKSVGVEWLISVSAVGSLNEKFQPLHMVIPDQLFDRTKARQNSFFGRGLVAHVAFAHPFSQPLRRILAGACATSGVTHHGSANFVVIDGPMFSTRCESELYRTWGMDIVGMTAIPEAKLAREAEISYAALAMVTDYDCWHPDHDSVTADQIIQNLVENAAAAQRVVKAAIADLPPAGDDSRHACEAYAALEHALVTAPELVPDGVKRDLAPIVGRYMPAAERS